MKKKIIVGILIAVVVLALIGDFFLAKSIGNSAGIKKGTQDCELQVLQYQTTTCQALLVVNNQITQSAISGCTPVK